MGSLQVGADTGGTFTDVPVVDDETGESRVGEVPSAPDEPGRAVLQAAKAVGVDLKNVVLSRSVYDHFASRTMWVTYDMVPGELPIELKGILA